MLIKLLPGKGLYAPRVLSIYLKPALSIVVFKSYREAQSSSRHFQRKTHPNQRLLTFLGNLSDAKAAPIADTSAASEAVALARRLAAQATQLVDSY
jgi:hypothetical protein